MNPKAQAASFFFAGLLPVIAFTLIEEYYGTVAGLIAGMVFGGVPTVNKLLIGRSMQERLRIIIC